MVELGAERSVIMQEDGGGPSRVAFQIKRWLVAALAMWFAGLAVDVFLEHYIALHSLAQWMPIIFGPLAAATALVTVWRFEGKTLRFFSVVAWISIGIGVLGLYYHAAAVMRRLESFQDLWNLPKLLPVLRYAPPLGAPGAFVAMGVLGLLVHTCALKLENVLVPTGAREPEQKTPTPLAYALFTVAFLAVVLAPFIPAMIHRLF